ncbi:MAG: sialidase family protein, partial [Patescibacteria group bacterium]
MKKLSIVLCVCLLFLVAGSAMALETEIKKNSVVSNLGLYGGQPETIAVQYSTDNVCVANFAPDGLFCSQDAGVSWDSSLSDVGVAKTVEVDQLSGIFYALVGDALLKSIDSGVSFTDITANVGSANFGNSISAGSGRILVAMNDGSVVVSTDNGATFLSATIASNSTINSLAAGPDINVFYAVLEDFNEDDFLYKSIDGGITWTDMQVHSNGYAAGGDFYRVGVDPLDGNHIVLTSSIAGNPNNQTLDGGISWQALTSGGQEIVSNYVAFDGAGRMFTGQFYTANASAAPIVWTTMDTMTPLSSLYYDTLAVDRGNPGTLYTNSGLGVAKSIDRGVNWTDQVDGITSVKTYAITQANNKDVVWIGANGGLGKTNNFTDDDPDWTYPILPDQSIANWRGIWVNPSNSDMVVAAGGTSIFKTINGNDATPIWAQATTPVFSGGGVMQIIADSNKDLYAVIYNDDLTGTDSGAVWTSTDKGSTWTNLSIPNDLPANCITMTSDGILFVGISGDVNNKGVYKMNKSGVWSRPSTDLNDFQITSILADPANADILYATATKDPNGGGFYKSEDKGVNWTKITDGIENVSNLSTLTIQTSTNPDTMYLAGQGNNLKGVIYKSKNAGASWDLLYTGLIQESFYALLYDGLVVGNDRGLFEIKSRATLKVKAKKNRVKKNNKAKLTFTLKDKATKKKLKNKKVRILKK